MCGRSQYGYNVSVWTFTVNLRWIFTVPASNHWVESGAQVDEGLDDGDEEVLTEKDAIEKGGGQHPKQLLVVEACRLYEHV